MTRRPPSTRPPSTRPRWARAAWRDEAGYTLAEVVVALALLVAVLVPTALAVVALTRSPVVRHRDEALARARAEVERALSEPAGTVASRTLGDGPWQVVRTVDRQPRYVGVTVEVSRLGRDPLATLETGRFVPPDPDPLPPALP